MQQKIKFAPVIRPFDGLSDKNVVSCFCLSSDVTTHVFPVCIQRIKNPNHSHLTFSPSLNTKIIPDQPMSHQNKKAKPKLHLYKTLILFHLSYMQKGVK